MVGTNSYVAKLKAQLDQAIIQREHWKQLAENRNSILVTEVCPESRSVEEYIIDADSVRASWRLIRGYREQIEALRAENAELRQQLAQSDAALRESRANDMANVRTLEDMWERHDALRQELEAALEAAFPLLDDNGLDAELHHCEWNIQRERKRLSNAARDILAERQRQITAEGWTPEHDDHHTCGEIADAAACYALWGGGCVPHHWRNFWPFDGAPKLAPARRMLVKAGALIIAEIERLDRAEQAKQQEKQ